MPKMTFIEPNGTGLGFAASVMQSGCLSVTKLLRAPSVSPALLLAISGYWRGSASSGASNQGLSAWSPGRSARERAIPAATDSRCEASSA